MVLIIEVGDGNHQQTMILARVAIHNRCTMISP